MAENEQQVAVAWLEAAEAWHLLAGPAGPAGHVPVVLGGVTWHADWMLPDRLVEAFVGTADGTPTGTIADADLALLERVLGPAAVGEVLTNARAVVPAACEISLLPREASARRSLGRLARSLAEVRWAGGVAFWSIEAVARCRSLVIDTAVVDGGSDLVDDAFDLVDSFPDDLVELLVDAGLGATIKASFDAANIRDSELPPALRLDHVDTLFDELVRSGALGRPDLPADEPAESARPMIGGPVRGRIRGPVLLGPEGGERVPTSGEVGRADVAPGAVESARWRRDGDVVHFDVEAVPSPWARYYVHINDAASAGGGRRIVELTIDPSVADSRFVQWVGRTDGSEIASDATFSLSRFDELFELVPELEARRDATSRSRDADHAARKAWILGSSDAWSLAAASWSAASEAWKSAGDPARSRLAGLEGSRCAAHAGDTDGARRWLTGPAHDQSLLDDTEDLVESTAERIVAIVSAYVDQALDQTDRLMGEDRARLARDLEVLCDSLGLAPQSTRARAVIAHWDAAGEFTPEDPS